VLNPNVKLISGLVGLLSQLGHGRLPLHLAVKLDGWATLCRQVIIKSSVAIRMTVLSLLVIELRRFWSIVSLLFKHNITTV
jgi:hypothetical protein